MKKTLTYLPILLLLLSTTIINCSDIEDISNTLDGNLNFELIYATDTTIDLNWDNSESDLTTLNIQAFVFDPNEHNSNMESASQNNILQIGEFSDESSTSVTVTASYYYVFIISDNTNEYYDCTESLNSSTMEQFDLCQTYLYLWGIFN